MINICICNRHTSMNEEVMRDTGTGLTGLMILSDKKAVTKAFLFICVL